MTVFGYDITVTSTQPTGPVFTGLGSYQTLTFKKTAANRYAVKVVAESDPNMAGVSGVTVVGTLTETEVNAVIYG